MLWKLGSHQQISVIQIQLIIYLLMPSTSHKSQHQPGYCCWLWMISQFVCFEWQQKQEAVRRNIATNKLPPSSSSFIMPSIFGSMLCNDKRKRNSSISFLLHSFRRKTIVWWNLNLFSGFRWTQMKEGKRVSETSALNNKRKQGSRTNEQQMVGNKRKSRQWHLNLRWCGLGEGYLCISLYVVG